MASKGLLDALPAANAVAFAGSAAVVFGVQRLVPTYDHTWYKAMAKPSWTPKNWVFPAVWIPLKIMQSVALAIVVRQAPRDKLLLPLAAFGSHLFLGNWWNVVFFGRRQLPESLTWMGAFWLSIAGTAAAFNTVSPIAAALMLPTQVWVTIAAKLNYDIGHLNTAEKK